MPNNGNDYQYQQEQIRKAKGNPNKNVHKKKNNSNYKNNVSHHSANVATTSSAPVRSSKEKKMPKQVKISIIVCFSLILVLGILAYAVFPGVPIWTYIVAFVSGAVCIYLYTKKEYFRRADSGAFYTIVWYVILLAGIFYMCLGGYSIIQEITA